MWLFADRQTGSQPRESLSLGMHISLQLLVLKPSFMDDSGASLVPGMWHPGGTLHFPKACSRQHPAPSTPLHLPLCPSFSQLVCCGALRLARCLPVRVEQVRCPVFLLGSAETTQPNLFGAGRNHQCCKINRPHCPEAEVA